MPCCGCLLLDVCLPQVGDTGLQIFISTLTKSTNASIGQETQSGGDAGTGWAWFAFPLVFCSHACYGCAGFAIFDGLQVVGQPGTSAEIIFVASQPVNVPPLVVTVHFAACLRGEVQPVGAQRCVMCDPGTNARTHSHNRGVRVCNMLLRVTDPFLALFTHQQGRTTGKVALSASPALEVHAATAVLP